MSLKEGAMIREARLDEFERRAGTGHSAIDVGQLVAECRRLRGFLVRMAVEIESEGPQPADVAARLRAAARAHGE